MSTPTTPQPNTGAGRLIFGLFFLVLALSHQLAGNITHPVSRLLDLLIFGGGGVALIRWWHLRRTRFPLQSGPPGRVLTTGFLGLICSFAAIDMLIGEDRRADVARGYGLVALVFLFLTWVQIRGAKRRRAETASPIAVPAATGSAGLRSADLPSQDAGTAEFLHEDAGTAELLREDARTAWAYRSYLARRGAEGVSPLVGERLLAALEPGDHAELILDAVADEVTDMAVAAAWGRDDAEPAVAMRTLRKWVLVDRREGETIVADGEVDRGVSRTAAHPEPGWAVTLEAPDETLFTMKVFVGGAVEEAVLEGGAGAYIKRIPETGSVPPMPATAPTPAVTSAAWRSAEEIARTHLESLGFTATGAEAGDILAKDAVARVRMAALPVDAAAVRQLRDSATGRPLFYATSGYTGEAIAAAGETGVALFEIGPDGAVTGVNEPAARLAAADVPAYTEAVTARIRGAVAATGLERFQHAERYPGQWERSMGYLRQALTNLDERPESFPSPRAAMVYHHHTELLAHVFFQEFGIPYPQGGVPDLTGDLDSYY